VNGIENTVESDFVSINSYKIILSIEIHVISINIDPFFFKNMNSESVVFCFVQKLIDDVSADEVILYSLEYPPMMMAYFSFYRISVVKTICFSPDAAISFVFFLKSRYKRIAGSS
jgi:hypothetical protein